MRLFAIALLSFLIISAPVMAETARFFEALYDVPIMPGLRELPDQTMLFDKPDGRIASVVAASGVLKEGQIAAFYEDVLPQLGWKKTTENQYVREDSQLSMEIVRKDPLTAVHFTLSPWSP